MKNFRIVYAVSFMILTTGLMSSCNDYLDREPLDSVSSVAFFRAESDVLAYTVSRYTENFDTFNNSSNDALQAYTDDDIHTDVMADKDASFDLWAPGYKRVEETGTASGWDFDNLRKFNYFLDDVLPKFEAGSISGSAANIKHCIGEIYFLRAYDNFKRLTKIGDSPIITIAFPDDVELLKEASTRKPRNEVARHILADLDLAVEYMQDANLSDKNRITLLTAHQFKSRVALYEGTWLKYHAGTARVPAGPNWPGARLYPNYVYPAGDIALESKFFLGEAMKAAEVVAQAVTLTSNNGTLNPPCDENGVGAGTGWNPYYEMFTYSDTDMRNCSEVLMFRSYSTNMIYAHMISNLKSAGMGIGMTRGFVESFPMSDGTTIDSPGLNMNYGDDSDKSLTSLKQNRDGRLQLFLASEDDIRRLKADAYGITFAEFSNTPVIDEMNGVPTGYHYRKYVGFDGTQLRSISSGTQISGCIVFRAAEALLNYIEADYELNGSLNANSQGWWQNLRDRAVAGSYEKTNQTTDISKEAVRDWAAYSGGVMLNDNTLYNIRRERRLELAVEGFRWNDLKRWASLSHVKDYIVEGFNLWEDGAHYDEYIDPLTGESDLIPDGTPGKVPTISSKNRSGNYVAPYRIIMNNNPVYWGYTWTEANYLEPIEIVHIKLASDNISDLGNSRIYQNPGWGLMAGESAK